MVEIEHNGNRYMVDGGQWFRLLEVGDDIPNNFEVLTEVGIWWPHCHMHESVKLHADDCATAKFRAKCPDPRLPFVVGQRVRVARGPAVKQYEGRIAVVHGLYDNGSVNLEFDSPGYIAAAWCLDAVYASPADELTAQAQEMGLYDNQEPT